MIQIVNLFIGVFIISSIIYFIINGIKMYRTSNSLYEIEIQKGVFLKYRNDLIQRFHISNTSDDPTKARDIEQELFTVDHKLKDLERVYRLIKSGEKKDIQKIR